MTCNPDLVACQLMLLRADLHQPDWWSIGLTIVIGLLSVAVAALGVLVGRRSNELANEAAERERERHLEAIARGRRAARKVYARQLREYAEQQIFDALRGASTPESMTKGIGELNRAGEDSDEPTAKVLFAWVFERISDARNDRARGASGISEYLLRKSEVENVANGWVEDVSEIEAIRKAATDQRTSLSRANEDDPEEHGIARQETTAS